MAEHFTVLDYDHRGYGQSDRPAGQTYGLDLWVDDLAALLHVLGIPKIHVHGGSMGGFIATRFAARYPERVEKLVIGGAVAKCDRMSRTQFFIWKAISEAYGVESEELALHLTTHAFSRTYLDSLGDTAVDEMREVTARNVTKDVFAAACDLMIMTDTREELQNIKAPTLVMVGEQDVITPLDAGPDGAGARFNDPFVPHRNGLNYLIPCLESHKPLAWVVIFLGANDLCDRYAMTAADIARGAATLAAATLKSESGRDGRAPHVLVLGLPRLGQHSQTMSRAAPKAAELSRCFSAAAEEAAVPLVDLAQVTAFSSLDGIHLDAEGHSVVAAAVGSAISSWPIATTQRTASSTA